MSCGLSLRCAGWTGAELAVFVPPFGTNTYKTNDNFPDGRASCFEIADDFITFANAPGRPWFLATTFAFSCTEPGVGLGQAFIGFKFDGGVPSIGWTPNATFTAQIGIVGITAQTVQSAPVSEPIGTVGVDFKVNGGRRHHPAQGGRAPNGAYVRSPGAFAARPLRLDAVHTEASVRALSEAIDNALSPTVGFVFHEAENDWIELVAIGEIPPPSRGEQLYRGSFDAWRARSG